MFALITMNAAGGRRPPRPCLAVCSRRAQPSGGQGGSSSAELRLPLRFIFTFVPPTARHCTAHWAPQPVPLARGWWLHGSGEPSPAIRPPELRPPHTSWPSPAAPWSRWYQWHPLPALQLSHAPWARTLFVAPNLPSQQLQVTKHPRLVSCSSLWFSDTKMQR